MDRTKIFKLNKINADMSKTACIKNQDIVSSLVMLSPYFTPLYQVKWDEKVEKRKKHILTNESIMQHPFAGWNIQHRMLLDWLLDSEPTIFKDNFE